MLSVLNGFFFGNIQPSNRICGSIEIFEDFWPHPENTIEILETQTNDSDSGVYWKAAETIGDGALQNTRTNKLMELTHLAKVTNNQSLQNIHNQFNVLLTSAISGYKKRYMINEEYFDEGYSVLKYSAGQYYNGHYDYASSNNRQLSAICYLNNDFEGGELEFKYFDIKIKPQPGMLILFPSNFTYSHVSHEVREGTKYALVTWLSDK